MRRHGSFEIAFVLVHLDQIAIRIVKANHGFCERLKNFA